MWISRKGKSHTLDVLILSILDRNSDGLTGYAVMKELEDVLKPIPVPGTGTIYPRLENLVISGDISKNGNLFQISPQGTKKVGDGIEEIIQQNLDYTRTFFRSLLAQLPLNKRTEYAWTFPRYFTFFSNSSDSHKDSLPMFDKKGFQCNCSTKIGNSIDDLKLAKSRMERAKETIKEETKNELIAIDNQIKSIEQQIQNLNQQTKSWTKIPIDDADS